MKTEHVQIFTYIYHFKCVFFYSNQISKSNTRSQECYIITKKIIRHWKALILSFSLLLHFLHFFLTFSFSSFLYSQILAPPSSLFLFPLPPPFFSLLLCFFFLSNLPFHFYFILFWLHMYLFFPFLDPFFFSFFLSFFYLFFLLYSPLIKSDNKLK